MSVCLSNLNYFNNGNVTGIIRRHFSDIRLRK
jgi:hypothetical protein